MRQFLFALLLLVAAAAETRADERIDRFASTITVNTDGSIDVAETIVWRFENIGRKRGLLRDFPTRYKNHSGFTVNVGFEVVGVTRDGRPEPFAVESISNGTRLRIGRADVFLDERAHTYVITYHATRMLGFFESYDELYWNVTGNDWTMPILAAEVRIALPPGAEVRQHAGYVGPQGSAEAAYRVIENSGGRFAAETTRPLAAHEGFTIAVGFTKGVVAAPSASDKAISFLRDNAGIGLLILGLIGVGGFYYYAWNRVGRDPQGGTIIPLFRPPEGLGPAGLRYVWQQGFDDKTFAASLVGLAVKGGARIFDGENGFAVDKLGAVKQPLTAGEQALHAALPHDRLHFKNTNHSIVSRVRGQLEKALGREFDGVAFNLNRGWFAAGLALSILFLVGGALLLPGEEAGTGLAMVLFSTVWWGVIIIVAVSTLRSALSGGIMKIVGAVFGLLFLIPFVVTGFGAPVLALLGLATPGLMTLAAAAVLFIALNALFFYLLKAPTMQGQKLLDQIEGFRMYMRTAEEDRLNALTPPEKTPQLFEAYLPYALALDCENEWNRKFAAVLAAAAVAAPAWYVGHHWNSGNLGGFTQSVGAGLASSTAAAATAPGSSSGSSGGGSSGGGGGGGGGSSW